MGKKYCQLAAFFSVILLCVVTQAMAYQYAASVSVQSSTYQDTGGWGVSSASDSITDANGSASASAGFYNSSPAIYATSTGALGYTKAIAGLDDYLTFSGTKTVTVHIAGNWSVLHDPANGGASYVHFSLGCTPANYAYQTTYDSWRSLVNGSVQQSGNLLGTAIWEEYSDNAPNAASGTYYYDLTTSVVSGQIYPIGLAVISEALVGETTVIDDPVTISLSDGVTFTSLSGSKYSAGVSPAAYSICFSVQNS